MLESLGTVLVIMAILLAWFGRDVLKEWFAGLEQDVKAEVAKSAVETSKDVQTANQELLDLIETYKDKGGIVSADDVIQKARGN